MTLHDCRVVSLLAWLGLPLKPKTRDYIDRIYIISAEDYVRYTHGPQGVNYRGYLHVLIISIVYYYYTIAEP